MDRPRHHVRVFFIALFISQVCGFPTFFWSQPDCHQEPSDDAYNGYGSFQGYNYQPPNSYQGPSYQDTLRGMVDDTVSAVNDIVLVTVTAVKQELVELSKILYDNFQSKNCNPAVDYGDSSDYNDMNQLIDPPVQIITFPGQSLGTQYPGSSQNKVPSRPIVETWPSLVTRNKTCSNSKGSDIDDRIANDQTNGSANASTNQVLNNTKVMYVHLPSSSSEKTTQVPTSIVSENPAHVDSTKIELNSTHSASMGGDNNTSVNSTTEKLSQVNSTLGGTMTEHMSQPVSTGNKTDVESNATSLAVVANKLTTVNTSSVPPTTESTNATSAITIDHHTTLHSTSDGSTAGETTVSTDGFTIGVDHVMETALTNVGSTTTETTGSSTFPIDFDIVTTMNTPINSSIVNTSKDGKTQSTLSMANVSQTLVPIVSASSESFETPTVANVSTTMHAASNVSTSESTTEGIKETTIISGIKPNNDQQFTPRLDSVSGEVTTKATRNPKL